VPEGNQDLVVELADGEVVAPDVIVKVVEDPHGVVDLQGSLLPVVTEPEEVDPVVTVVTSVVDLL
jgi:hypothetical protein